MTMRYTTMKSPVGELLLGGDGDSLRALRFLDAPSEVGPDPSWKRDPAPFREAASQLRAYFAGELRSFDLPLAPEGTPFQKKVWSQLRKIPWGRTISYGELARRVGNGKASRAVGRANGTNRIAIVIPCHRVIAGDGSIGGYGGGLDAKRTLLTLENVEVR